MRRHRLRERLAQVRVSLGTWCRCYNSAQVFVITVLVSIFHGRDVKFWVVNICSTLYSMVPVRCKSMWVDNNVSQPVIGESEVCFLQIFGSQGVFQVTSR